MARTPVEAEPPAPPAPGRGAAAPSRASNIDLPPAVGQVAEAAETSYTTTGRGAMTDGEAAVSMTVGHHLLHRHEDGDNDEAGVTSIGTEVPYSIAFRLYASHFLSTWNSRLFEFGAALFLTSVFPGTLLPVSIYSLVRNAGYIVFAHPLGEWINKGNRLNIVRTSIVGQRIPVAASCALLLVLELKESTLGYRKDNGIFAVIVLLAVVEKLCSTLNTISVERDWVSKGEMQGVVALADLERRLLSSQRATKWPVEVSDSGTALVQQGS